MSKNDLKLLNLNLAHLDLIESLPFHHKDPFDRLLIAQSQAENLTVVGADDVFDRYGAPRLWFE